MVAASPTAVDPIFVDTKGRFGGYQYIIDNPDAVDAFFSGYIH
jgi:hypothetical protein